MANIQSSRLTSWALKNLIAFHVTKRVLCTLYECLLIGQVTALSQRLFAHTKTRPPVTESRPDSYYSN